MTHHNELLNFLIEKFQLTSYLEIGTFNRSHNFDLVQCREKTCVDPDPNAKADYECTSDFFFETINNMDTDEGGGKKFDLIFIDGLHHADQVKKDFDNALECLNDKGFIVMHDCNPHSENITHVPRDSREWCGDVYKFASTLQEYPGINFVTIDFDYGCSVVWRDPWRAGIPIGQPVTWDYFQKNRSLLRLISPEALVTLCYNRASITINPNYKL